MNPNNCCSINPACVDKQSANTSSSIPITPLDDNISAVFGVFLLPPSGQKNICARMEKVLKTGQYSKEKKKTVSNEIISFTKTGRNENFSITRFQYFTNNSSV